MYEEVYYNTNENLNLYKLPELDSKKVLTVTSSTDQMLYVIKNEGLDVTVFHIDKFAKIYSNLKIAMIKSFKKIS